MVLRCCQVTKLASKRLNSVKIRNVAGKRRGGMKAAQGESGTLSETFAAMFRTGDEHEW
jgi:hypothetical protein